MRARKSESQSRPKILIFDVDGVLIEVSGSFHRSIIDTVHYFTGQRVTTAEIHQWKNRSGYNDDWRLSTDWIASLGGKIAYEEVKARFQAFYWGSNGLGNVRHERWLVSPGQIARWAKTFELALFTGRSKQELSYTLKRSPVAMHFRNIVTMEDVKRLKPAPDGLHKILNGRDPGTALYLGDNIDDALAARSAGVPFIGVLPIRSEARRARGASLRELGAVHILSGVRDLDAWLKR